MPFAIVRDDVTAISADAVVVPSNEQLLISGGVGGQVAAIAGREQLQAAANAAAPCPVASAVAVSPCAYPARCIVFATGPQWPGSPQPSALHLLQAANLAALEAAAAHGCRSIALPLISAGNFSFPAQQAFACASAAVREFLANDAYADIMVTLALFERDAVCAGSALVGEIAELVDDAYVMQRLEREGGRSSWRRDPRGRRQHRGSEPAACAGALGSVSREAPFKQEAPAYEDIACLGSAPEHDYNTLSAGFAEPFDDGSFDEDPTVLSEAHLGSAPKHTHAAVCLDADPCLSAAPEPSAAASTALPLFPHRTPQPQGAPSDDIETLLAQLDEPFSEVLVHLIDTKGMTDPQVYRAANMTRQTFSKIRNNPQMQPTKRSVLALAVALKLSTAETEALLARAGYALSPASPGDVIVRYFLDHGMHNIFDINEMLYRFDQQLL